MKKNILYAIHLIVKYIAWTIIAVIILFGCEGDN